MKTFKAEKINRVMYVGEPHEIAPIFKAFERQRRKEEREAKIPFYDMWGCENKIWDRDSIIDYERMTSIIIDYGNKTFFTPTGLLTCHSTAIMLQPNLKVTETKEKIQRVSTSLCYAFRIIKRQKEFRDRIVVCDELGNNIFSGELTRFREKYSKLFVGFYCYLHYDVKFDNFDMTIYYNNLNLFRR